MRNCSILLRRLAQVTCVFACMAALISLPVQAQEQIQHTSASQKDTYQLGKRINIAGRQRMLIQRAARASCFVLKGVAVEQHYAMSQSAIELFETSQNWLRDGDQSTEVKEETAPAVLERLEIVDHHWQTLGAANRQVSHGDLKRTVMLQLVNMTDQVMVFANETVKALVALSASDRVDPAMARTIDLAGRQRMISQRATKEFCFLVLGASPNVQKQKLARSVALFEETLTDLEYGRNGLVAPPNAEIEQLLTAVREHWNPLKTMLRDAIDGKAYTTDEMIHIGNLSEDVLINMNKAVMAYVAAS